MQFSNKERIIQRVSMMPKGETSPSNHYWCVTCKMLFNISEPVCPYMPKVCINTPVPIELAGPESTIALEKFGLFYPKIPQHLLSGLLNSDLSDLGRKLANNYLDFLKEWNFQYKHEPIQALKSFLIILTGCETAQRVRKDELIFVITDLKKIWDKDKLFAILDSALEVLKQELNVKQSISLDEIDIIGENATGKYYCGMCNKFFEFSTQKEIITCPLMAQKCMAVPTNIEKTKHTIEDLLHVYEYTPDIFKRFIKSSILSSDTRENLKSILSEEWKMEIDNDTFDKICKLFGI